MSETVDISRVETLLSQTFVRDVEWHAELASTNDRALELCASGAIETPHLVVADRQTAGRGRGANAWWSGPGALTFSLIIATEQVEVPPVRWPQVSLTTGLAVCEAVSSLLPTAEVSLKWPNDVHLHRRKVCGILVEVPGSRRGTLVLGIGINVNNLIADAPAELRETAISLADAAGVRLDRPALLTRVLQQIERELAHLAQGNPELAERWQALCCLRGRHVRLVAGEREHAGRCHGIDSEGALVIETEAGRQPFFGGVIAAF